MKRRRMAEFEPMTDVIPVQSKYKKTGLYLNGKRLDVNGRPSDPNNSQRDVGQVTMRASPQI